MRVIFLGAEYFYPDFDQINKVLVDDYQLQLLFLVINYNPLSMDHPSM